MAALLLMGTSGIVMGQQKSAATKPAATPAAGAVAASVARGKVIYQNICLACHQADGSGVPRMNPPLIKTGFVLGDKTKLITIVLKGLNDDVEIEGEYYSNPMPPQAQLKDQEIADVLTFVRNSFGNKASAVKPGDVKTVRAKLK
jgi:mono/diheme cytochrome c family protein